MAGLYFVGAWLLVQIAETILPAFEVPAWVLRAIIIVLALGLVPALVFSWLFELTPSGLKRDTEVAIEDSIAPQNARRLDRMIILVLALALGYFAFDKFVLAPKRDAVSVASSLSANAAKTLIEAPSAPREKSIAVLPFVDMSQNNDQEYFSDGIAEELLNKLSEMPDLRVAARTSAFQFRGKNLDIADIGRQLKVAHVLEGSVRKAGERVRITAQLIDISTGYHLWSETFEREASDIFAVQDEISLAIATALKSTLGGAAVASGQSTPVDPVAYDDYLQGRAYFALRVDNSLPLAIEAFDRAIARDPAYSAAHSGRAFALANSGAWVPASVPVPWESVEESLALAVAAADEAVRLDQGNAEAYLARAVVAHIEFRIADARTDFERALALAPDNVEVLNFYADFLGTTADLRRSEAMKRRAMVLDPLAFIHPLNLSQILGGQGRYAEAVTLAQRSLQLGMPASIGLDQAFWMKLQLNELDAAAQLQAQGCTRIGDSGLDCLIQKVGLLVATGQKSEAELAMQALTRLPVSNGGDAYDQSRFAALYANELHDIPRATAAMRRALAGTTAYVYVAFPFMDGRRRSHLPEEISDDPEWLALWEEPALREFMQAYRTNLLAFRKETE